MGILSYKCRLIFTHFRTILQENVSSVNSLDTKEKVITSQNIPPVSTVPAQLIMDTNKTESKNFMENSVYFPDMF